MLPVRCFTCGKIIGKYEVEWSKLVKEGKNKNEILDDFGMTRYCCRRMFLGHVNIINNLCLFPKTIKKQ